MTAADSDLSPQETCGLVSVITTRQSNNDPFAMGSALDERPFTPSGVATHPPRRERQNICLWPRVRNHPDPSLYSIDATDVSKDDLLAPALAIGNLARCNVCVGSAHSASVCKGSGSLASLTYPLNELSKCL